MPGICVDFGGSEPNKGEVFGGSAMPAGLAAWTGGMPNPVFMLMPTPVCGEPERGRETHTE